MFAASQRRGDGFQTAKDFIFEASDGGICRISSDRCERVFVEVHASEVDRFGEERHRGRLLTKPIDCNTNNKRSVKDQSIDIMSYPNLSLVYYSRR